MRTMAGKSRGCIHKGDTTPINWVVGYGERPAEKGLILQGRPPSGGYSMAALAASQL